MRITQIQALRALASLLVVVYHAKLVSGGYIGVDIFYVISGYLITGLIISEMDKTKTLNFKAFYLRRIKRLLPTSFFVLVVTALLSWWLFPVTMRSELGKDILAAGVYLSNYLFAFWQMDYQNLNVLPPVVIHYWSLAVEEQFYLFWPFIIFLLYRSGSKKKLLTGIIATTLFSFIWSLHLTTTSPIWAFYSLPTRAWELGVGALLLFIPKRIRFSPVYAWVSLLLIIYGTLHFNDNTAFPGTAALIPVIAAAIAIAAIASWPRVLNAVGNHKVVQWLGEISYPLYLWHWPLLVIPAVYFGRGLHIYERAICISLTLLAADLTHRFIEQPLRHKNLQRKVIIRGALASTLISLLLAIGITFTGSNNIHLSNGDSLSLTSILSKPKVYDDGCHVNNGDSISGDCTYGDKTSNTKVVLFGDSHAAQWFPALEKLANQYHFTLISLTKSACPGPAVVKVETGAYKNADCTAWRESSYKRIRSIHPTAVIVSGMQNYQVPSGYSSRNAWWLEGERKTLAALQGSSTNIFYIRDTPHPSRDIPSCLAAGRQDKCNANEPSIKVFASGFKNIDPTHWLCGKQCPAIVNGTVAYRDASHLTVAMSEHLAPLLMQALTSNGLVIKP